MRLVGFHIGGDEWCINPDNILHAHKHNDKTVISLVDESYITVDETLKTVVARINNQELNVAYDCMGEIERIKQKLNHNFPLLEGRIKDLTMNTQPSEI